MRIAIGADHAGYLLKDKTAKRLAAAGHAVTDFGTHSSESVDYPDFAAAVANAVRDGRADRGVVICGSGAGAVIAANKVKDVRALMGCDTYTAHQAVEHDDANVICFGSRTQGELVTYEILDSFLKAEFINEERYVRRLNKVKALEAG